MRTSAIILSFLLAATPALAVPLPDHPGKQQPVRHNLRKPATKTAVNPQAPPSPDPDAGISENGAPNPAVTNGGELAH